MCALCRVVRRFVVCCVGVFCMLCSACFIALGVLCCLWCGLCFVCCVVLCWFVLCWFVLCCVVRSVVCVFDRLACVVLCVLFVLCRC